MGGNDKPQPQRQAAPQAPQPQHPGPGLADMGDQASAQASTPATPEPDRPSSRDVQAQFTAVNPRPPATTKRTQLFATADTRMRNASQTMGFYRDNRIKPNRIFTLRKGDPVGSWMEPVDPALKDELAEALDASPKRRGSAGVELKRPDRRVTGRGVFEPGANSDDGI